MFLISFYRDHRLLCNSIVSGGFVLLQAWLAYFFSQRVKKKERAFEDKTIAAKASLAKDALKYEDELKQFAFVNQARFSLYHTNAAKNCERIYAFLTEAHNELLALPAICQDKRQSVISKATRYVNKAEMRALNARLYLPDEITGALTSFILEQRRTIAYAEETDSRPFHASMEKLKVAISGIGSDMQTFLFEPHKARILKSAKA
jgi:hypothetical protein